MRRSNWYDYDSALQMIRTPPQEPDVARLEFLKWLVETGRLDDDITPAYQPAADTDD